MYDTLDTMFDATIQHGSINDRIYLMKIGNADPAELVKALDKLAAEKPYTKIFAKIPARFEAVFEENAFSVEARVPDFYNGATEAVFMAKYVDTQRGVEARPDRVRNVLDVALGKDIVSPPELDPRFTYHVLDEKDAEDVCEVYKVVFETYPFPIHQPDYIRKTMKENIVYFGIREKGKLIAVSSSEMDEKSSNVEMTDFATLPDYRGNGFALFLLGKMEPVMKERGIKMAYTIARAVSFGMNATFAKLGYKYGGTLIANTNICGDMESMNIWYKPL